MCYVCGPFAFYFDGVTSWLAPFVAAGQLLPASYKEGGNYD